MFKLVKIEGSGTNQPEPVRMPTSTEMSYKSGGAYILYDARLESMDYGGLPTHIAIESAEKGEKRSILCYRIQDNMIFEVPADGDTRLYNQGKKYILKKDSTGAGIGIMDDSSTDGIMVHDKRNRKKPGDSIYVRVTADSSI